MRKKEKERERARESDIYIERRREGESNDEENLGRKRYADIVQNENQRRAKKGRDCSQNRSIVNTYYFLLSDRRHFDSSHLSCIGGLCLLFVFFSSLSDLTKFRSSRSSSRCV